MSYAGVSTSSTNIVNENQTLACVIHVLWGPLSLSFFPQRRGSNPEIHGLDHTTTCGSYTSLEGRSQA